jgi:peptide deformylase
MRKIVTDKKQLKNVCKKVSLEESHQIGKILVYEMGLHGNALGLAAPQLGYDARVFATKFSGIKPFDGEKYFINPEILEKSEPIMFSEGCLSIPGKFVDKIRWSKLVVRDEVGGPYEISGLPAIIFQHELEHLDGKLMDDEMVDVYSLCPCGSGKKFKFCHMKKNA